MRLISLAILPLLVGCTLSFSNVNTHGTATDLIDEQQAASAEVAPVVNIPAM